LNKILNETEPDYLKMIFEKYPEIKINELTLLDDVFESPEKLFMEFLNFDNLTQLEKSLNILDLFNDYTNKHDEIFKNIENKDEINDKNWIDIV
jgi:hypothetical protein